jgi:4-diphosphocytidyl-2-C-methyl-D-erythritol kinase
MEKTIREILVLAPAKINICLGVTGKRADGYHDIDSVMQTVSIYDNVRVRIDECAQGQSIEVVCPGHEELFGQKNIAYRVAEAFVRYAKIEKYDIYIEIEKVIPMEAGLGGGSSDAAAVVCALNMLLDTKLSEEELMAIGATVGADVPFLVFRGTAFVQGIGDKIERCDPLRPVPVLVAYPHSEKVSTGKAYAAIDARGEFSSTEDFEKMKAAVLAQDIERIGALSYNIFESVIDESSDIFRIKKEMLVHGAVFSLMSGSGSAVFGVFREESDAEKAAKALDPLAKTFVSSFC